MKNTKWKYILRLLAAVSVLAALLVSLNGCKKKPAATEPSSTAETTEETNETEESTKETVGKQDVTESTQETTIAAETEEELCIHVLGDWIVDEPSNCTKEGSRYKKCTLCDKAVETEVIPKTTHTPGRWEDDPKQKATCSSPGKKYQKCSQCKALLAAAVMGKSDHNAKTVSGYAATAASPGRTDSVVCIVCDKEVQKSFTIPPVGSVPYVTRVSGSSCTITGVGSWAGDTLVLPEKIDGKTVTGIGDGAFRNMTSIKNVYIPKTVKSIGAEAFSGCSALADITYQGTTMQWSTGLAKGAGWDENTGRYQVFCTNNSLTK